MNGGASGGMTLAAEIVPISLTAISSSIVSLIGLTCLNHSTWTRSESFTTIGKRSYSFLNRPSYQREFHMCESQCSTLPVWTLSATPVGTFPASWSKATSASISTSCFHGSRCFAMFQQTIFVAISTSERIFSSNVARSFRTPSLNQIRFVRRARNLFRIICRLQERAGLRLCADMVPWSNSHL